MCICVRSGFTSSQDASSAVSEQAPPIEGTLQPAVATAFSLLRSPCSSNTFFFIYSCYIRKKERLVIILFFSWAFLFLFVSFLLPRGNALFCLRGDGKWVIKSSCCSFFFSGSYNRELMNLRFFLMDYSEASLIAAARALSHAGFLLCNMPFSGINRDSKRGWMVIERQHRIGILL